MDKLKVFISMPMNGKTKSEIDECTQQAVADIHKFIAENGYKGKKDYDIEAFSGYVELEENTNVRNSALNYMGASLQKMAEADVVWACVGWRAARGCLLEIKAASVYGIDTLLCFSYGEGCLEEPISPICVRFLDSKDELILVHPIRNFTADELRKIEQDMQTCRDKVERINIAINTKKKLNNVLDRVVQGFTDGLHPLELTIGKEKLI